MRSMRINGTTRPAYYVAHWLLMYCILTHGLLGPPTRTTPTAARLLAGVSADILVAPLTSSTAETNPRPPKQTETAETNMECP
jgi:hypothetical protein